MEGQITYMEEERLLLLKLEPKVVCGKLYESRQKLVTPAEQDQRGVQVNSVRISQKWYK